VDREAKPAQPSPVEPAELPQRVDRQAKPVEPAELPQRVDRQAQPVEPAKQRRAELPQRVDRQAQPVEPAKQRRAEQPLAEQVVRAAPQRSRWLRPALTSALHPRELRLPLIVPTLPSVVV
jgi:hypothetical protein